MLLNQVCFCRFLSPLLIGMFLPPGVERAAVTGEFYLQLLGRKEEVRMPFFPAVFQVVLGLE